MSNRVLFISGRCPHSKKILLGIKQHIFLKELFKIVNVDTQPFPNFIKTVPCILINNQVVTGTDVFEYFGRLVEGKKQQEQREQKNELKESDQGQCRINEDGELEGYCGMDNFSLISEENDDFTKRKFNSHNYYDMLDDSDGGDIHAQVKEMEQNDNQLNQKNKGFDQDLERMQRERGEIQMGGAGNPMGPGGGGPQMGGGGPQMGGMSMGGIKMSGPDERFQGL